MNSTALRYDSVVKSNLEQLENGLNIKLTSIINRLKDFFSHYHFAQAQNIYELKRKREIQAQHQNILQQLPLEEKIRLGLHHLM